MAITVVHVKQQQWCWWCWLYLVNPQGSSEHEGYFVSKQKQFRSNGHGNDTNVCTQPLGPVTMAILVHLSEHANCETAPRTVSFFLLFVFPTPSTIFALQYMLPKLLPWCISGPTSHQALLPPPHYSAHTVRACIIIAGVQFFVPSSLTLVDFCVRAPRRFLQVIFCGIKKPTSRWSVWVVSVCTVPLFQYRWVWIRTREFEWGTRAPGVKYQCITYCVFVCVQGYSKKLCNTCYFFCTSRNLTIQFCFIFSPWPGKGACGFNRLFIYFRVVFIIESSYVDRGRHTKAN